MYKIHCLGIFRNDWECTSNIINTIFWKIISLEKICWQNFVNMKNKAEKKFCLKKFLHEKFCIKKFLLEKNFYEKFYWQKFCLKNVVAKKIWYEKIFGWKILWKMLCWLLVKLSVNSVGSSKQIYLLRYLLSNMLNYLILKAHLLDIIVGIKV